MPVNLDALEVIPQQGRMFRTGTNRRIQILVPDARRRSSCISVGETALLSMEEQVPKNSAVHGARIFDSSYLSMGGRLVWMESVDTRRRAGGCLLHDFSQRRVEQIERYDPRSRVDCLATMARSTPFYSC